MTPALWILLIVVLILVFGIVAAIFQARGKGVAGTSAQNTSSGDASNVALIGGHSLGSDDNSDAGGDSGGGDGGGGD